eukprot:g63766.t1
MAFWPKGTTATQAELEYSSPPPPHTWAIRRCVRIQPRGSIFHDFSCDPLRHCIVENLGLPPLPKPPWQLVISTCAAGSHILETTLEMLQMGGKLSASTPGRPNARLGLWISLPSVHFIGK